MKDWKPENIKAFRKRLKLSQRAFGDLVGVTRMHIYYIERGERVISKTLHILLNYIEREFKENEKGKEVKKHGKRHL